MSIKWELRGLQNYDMYISEEEMYELLFSSQQPKAKDFRKRCCNVMFPHTRQQLTEKLVHDLRCGQQQPIEKQYHQITAIQYQNVGLHSEIRAKDQDIAALQRCRMSYVANEDKKVI